MAVALPQLAVAASRRTTSSAQTVAALVLSVIALASPGAAEVRPTQGGNYAYDASDIVESWEEPGNRVRVHYSASGPTVTLLDDIDDNGTPDFVEDVALSAVDVLDLFADLGLRPPLSEEDLGLGPLGGSPALDVYLVDFAGTGDGHFGVDGCTDVPFHCAGHLLVENDFSGYGYPSLELAVDVLTSHELFHAVQDAYDSGQGSWFSEGTAVWAERQFDPDSVDFLRLVNAYLADTGRSLDVPPLGPVSSWAYGTALWWDFLTLRHDVSLMHELLLATESEGEVPADTLAGMEAVIEARGDTLAEAWMTFASWNLATAGRAGVMPGYPYARALRGIASEANGTSIDDDNRFYPLATTYYRLEHEGGAIWFGLGEAAPGLHFALHPVVDGKLDGPVEPALHVWTGMEATPRPLADEMDLPAGGYWIVGAQPAIADGSIKVRVCIGSQEVAALCEPEDQPDGGALDASTEPGAQDGGCSCAVGGLPSSGAGAALAAIVLLAVVRRRRPRS